MVGVSNSIGAARSSIVLFAFCTRVFVLDLQPHRPNKLSSALFRGSTGFSFRCGFLGFFGCGKLAALLRGPAGFVDLAAASDSQSIRRDVLRDRLTGVHID